jgi:hypothetical protein
MSILSERVLERHGVYVPSTSVFSFFTMKMSAVSKVRLCAHKMCCLSMIRLCAQSSQRRHAYSDDHRERYFTSMNVGLKTTKVDVRKGWDSVPLNLCVSRKTRQMLFTIEKIISSKAPPPTSK